MKPFHNNIRRIGAILIGLVFFAAGLLKLIDPVGAGLIVEEYFKFFQLGFLSPVAKFIGVTLSLWEAITGAALVTGVYRKFFSITASVLIGIFTLVTFFLWIFNPSMDCGCFGEAIHLSHLQTFLKNIILLFVGIVAFVPFRDYGNPKRKKLVTFWISAASIVGMSIYCLFTIPPVDFTPFNSSSMLSAAKSYGTLEKEEYVQSFVYEKNGHKGSFTIDNLPDSSWTFVRTEPMKKSDNIEETDFPELSFRDAKGSYKDTLAAKGAVIVVSVYNPDKMSAVLWRRASDLLKNASGVGYKSILLVASSPESMRSILSSENLKQEEINTLLKYLYFADYKTLISMNRSNGGAVYFNDGNLIQKWHSESLPDKISLEWVYNHDSVDNMIDVSTKGRLIFQSFVLYNLILFLI
jgi:hypothetical protein